MTEKKIKKSNEKKTKNETPEDIIMNHVIFSMTAGAIPIPLVDFISITAIQVDMLKQLARFHSVDFDTNKGKTLASSLVGTSMAKIGASAVKALPGVGTLIGIGAQVIFAGGSTYALGKVFEQHFSNNKTLADFNTEKMKEKYDDFLKKGKKIAKDLKNDMKKDDIFNTIEKLKKLKDTGAITEKDFEKSKKDLLDKLAEQY